MEYLDFDLQLDRIGEQFLARVVVSPAGQAEAAFRFPFEEKDLEIFRLKVGQTRKGVRRANSPEMALVQEYGARLFTTIFDGEIHSCFRNSNYQARREGKGLRLRLRVKDPGLANLPWEYLYNPSLNRFLSLAKETPLVRYIDLSEPLAPLEMGQPLKILTAIASPRDYPPLDVEGEWMRLNQALSGMLSNRSVYLERLLSPTLSALLAQLRHGGPYHILHFIGHGDFDERMQDGLLIFENEQGASQLVNGQRLGAILHNHPSLRLAVLNACEGARTSAIDPFAGVAHSLIQQGLPTVIAMQFEITERAAQTFAHEFYSALAAGSPVDAALAEARVAIFADNNDIEWGTPVLFTRLPDGRLFHLSSQPSPAQSTLHYTALDNSFPGPQNLLPEAHKALKEGERRERLEGANQRAWQAMEKRRYLAAAIGGVLGLFMCLALAWTAAANWPTLSMAFLPPSRPTLSMTPTLSAKQQETPSVIFSFTPTMAGTTQIPTSRTSTLSRTPTSTITRWPTATQKSPTDTPEPLWPPTGATIRGKVIWCDLPISNVGVYLFDDARDIEVDFPGTENFITDIDGVFIIENPPLGTYLVHPQMPGEFYSSDSPYVTVSPGAMLEATIHLAKEIKLIEPSGSSLSTQTPTFRWLPYPGITDYVIRLYQETPGSNVLQDVLQMNTEFTEHILSSPLIRGARYRFYLEGYDSNNCKVGAARLFFTVQE
jgi:hypothetical protein